MQLAETFISAERAVGRGLRNLASSLADGATVYLYQREKRVKAQEYAPVRGCHSADRSGPSPGRLGSADKMKGLGLVRNLNVKGRIRTKMEFGTLACFRSCSNMSLADQVGRYSGP